MQKIEKFPDNLHIEYNLSNYKLLVSINTQSCLTTPYYPILDVNMYTEEESIFLNNHITKSIDSQIKYINTAINISKNPEMWWSELISECIDKSAKWCDTFRVNSHPLRSYLKILSDKYPHISVKLPVSSH